MSDEMLFWVASTAFYLFGVIVSLLILWAIIRGATLSALRKHSEEQAAALRRANRM